MMVYTTSTAATQFQDARKPKIRRPAGNLRFDFSTLSFPKVEIGSRTRKLASQPLAVR